MSQTPAKIMVVEDEAIVSMDLQRRLRDMNYLIVAEASSGPEAIVKAEKSKPDLILMDIMIKGAMDGIETADHIRKSFDIPIIYVTAYGDPGTLERAKVTEPYGYILKPFDEREIQIAVEIALYKHKTDQKFRKVEKWLGATMRSIGDAVISTDLSGCVTFMNPEAEKLTGWSFAEAIGKPFSELFSIIDGTTNTPIVSPIQNALREGVAVGLAENSLLIQKNGQKLPIDDSAAPIRDDKGQIKGVVMVFRDISKQVNSKEELDKTRERLRQAEKMESVGRLAGGIAHDFNNLMTVVMGHSAMLLNKDFSTNKTREKIQLIHQAAERASSVTRQLLAFSRKQIVTPSDVNLNERVEHTLNLLQQLVGEDVHIDYVPCPGAPVVKMDPVQLDQIVINLAANARDAMPEGGKLRFVTEFVTLNADFPSHLEDIPAGRYVRLTVADTGQGMSEETKAHLFEPFYTTKELGKGTGMGLATVYGIVRQSGGYVDVKSALGSGTAFELYLPPSATQPTAASPGGHPGSTSTSVGGTETILVVDDNPDIRMITSEVLSERGYQVLEASTGKGAMDHATKRGTDIALILSDIYIADSNGVDLVEQIKPHCPRAKVLFMSGGDDPVASSRRFKIPDSSFINKPFNLNILERRVRDLLDAR